MKITVLLENNKLNENFCEKHGLSLYIETNNHKILFDAGDDLLFENAKKLNIDLSFVDIIVISHGHYDHTNGLNKLLTINKIAKVYILKTALNEFYKINKDSNQKKYIGINKDLLYKINNNIDNYADRFVFTFDGYEIDKGLTLYSNFKQIYLNSISNNNLYVLNDCQYYYDTFDHEQVLIISEENNTNTNNVLFGGCCHNGILNILNKLKHLNINYCISGFHFKDLDITDCNDVIFIYNIFKELLKENIKFYTLHCTGLDIYNFINNGIDTLKNKSINYLYSGSNIII